MILNNNIKIMKIFAIFLFIHFTNADDLINIVECKDGCREGPVKLPYYFCQCPLTVNPELSTCIRKCANDVFCRLCYGNKYLGLPPLCPLIIKEDIDLSGRHFDFFFKNGTKIRGLDQAIATDLFYFEPVTRFARANLLVGKLTIEGEYKIAGKFCDDIATNSEGYLKITFENLTLDWYPNIGFILKCNIPYFLINGPKSNLILSTNKKVKFEFKENKTSDYQISQCVDDKWDEVLDKIINQLQQFFNKAFLEYTNILSSQIPLYYIFKIGSVTPLSTVVIPGGILPGGLLPGGDIIGSLPILTSNFSLERLVNIGLTPSNLILNNTLTANFISRGVIPNVFLP